MILQIFTDGGSKGNPGPSAIGIAFYINGKLIDTYREDIGHATNNEAEYRALIKALEIVKVQNVYKVNNLEKIEIFSDSKLIVQQVNGLWKVKEARIRDFIFKIRTLEREIDLPIRYTHIPREKNMIADQLVNNKL